MAATESPRKRQPQLSEHAPDTVACPCCQAMVSLHCINEHLDEGCPISRSSAHAVHAESFPSVTCPPQKRTRVSLLSPQGDASVAPVPVPAAAPLPIGARVLVVGLGDRPEFNGAHGTLAEYSVGVSRWKVRMDDGSERLVKSSNLEVARAEAVVAQGSPDSPSHAEPLAPHTEESDAFHDAASVVSDDAASTSSQATPPEMSALEAALTGMRDGRFNEVDAVSEVARTRVVTLRQTLVDAVRTHQPELRAYVNLSQPTTFEELSQRNKVRRQLELVARAAEDNIEQIFALVETPAEELQTAEDEVLQKIDDCISCLTTFREKTAQQILQRQAAAKEEREVRKRDLVAVASCVAQLDGFVQRWSEEVRSETREGRDVYCKQIEQFQEEEARYVRANDSPDKNPAFARVRSDVAFARERLCDQDTRAAAVEELLKRWALLQSRLPAAELGDESKEADVHTCENGHVLKLFSSSGTTFKCDRCGGKQRDGVVLYGCRQCDFDVCVGCVEQATNDAPATGRKRRRSWLFPWR